MTYQGALHSGSIPLARIDNRDTIIDMEPQTGLYERPMARLKNISTNQCGTQPEGRQPGSTEITPSSDATSQRSSLWSKPHSVDSDDELYTLTDDDSVEVPLMCSDSVKKRATKPTKARYPSLVIPSPSHWPMPPSACKQSACSIGISPVSKIAPSPARLAAFNLRQHNRIPSRTSTPSLDGSMTSEELAACSSDSCPSTPDRQAGSPNPGEWEPPAQLGAEAFALLNSLAPDTAGSGSESGDIDMPDDAVHEMRQIVRDPPVRHQLIPGSDLSVPNFTPGSEPVSALTVPSPGGFFASLHASARQTWCVSTSPPPSTGTAEQFYGVPWRSNSPPRNPGLRLDTQRAVTPPPFLRKDSLFSPTDGLGIEATEITESAFQAASQGGSEPQSERTKNWLFAQWTYLSTITTESPKVETPKTPENKIKSCFSPDTPSTGRTNPFEDSPSKKSVRFLESVPESEEATFTHRSAEVEPLFFQGFKYISSRFRGMDAFLHSQTRAEASHVSSSSLNQQHMSQLSGSFTLHSPDRPHPARPISALVPTATDEDEHSKTITLAERERQALEQIMPSVWSLHAARHVFGSTLIASPAIAHLRSSPNRRILDYGGAPSCDWGWAVALQFRHCAVVTVPFDPIPTLSAPLTGPPNHSIIHAPNLTTLPFPSASFDLISARSLHVLLRTIHPDPATHPTRDEYDALLSEFLRVLKPGGYLEFNLLDAELLHPGPLGQALSVEFAFVLRQRGYDPQASRYFLPRLRKAGFEDVKRAWLVLPAADVVPRWVDKGKMMAGHGRGDSGVGLKGEAEEREGERFFEVERVRSAGGRKEVFEPPVVGRTRDVRGMTGLVGARAWEKWVLKVQREAGGNEEKMLERVNRALEEAGRVKAGWRCLMGWARKAE